MNTGLTTFLVLSAFLLLPAFTGAQEKVIYGIVTTLDSIPLPEAHVRIKSTKVTVVTDSLGQFSAIVHPADRLKVTASGFFNQKVKLEENTKFAFVNLKLKPSFTLSFQNLSNGKEPFLSTR
jgi:hypothetical protein